MPPRNLALTVVATLFGASLLAQSPFALQRATAGTIGTDLQFEFTSTPAPYLILAASFATGTTPLPPEISALPLAIAPPSFLFPEVVAGANGLTTAIPIPNDLLLMGMVIQWQAASLPGTTTLLAGLSNRVATQLAPLLLPTMLPSQSTGCAWGALVRRPGANGVDDAWLHAGGALRPTSPQNPQNTSDVFDPNTLEVSAGPLLPQPLYAMSCTELADGRTLLTGGITKVGGNLNVQVAVADAVLYEPIANQFAATQPMAFPRWLHGAGKLGDGRVVVAGGSASADLGAPIPLHTVEVFDPTTNTWSAGPSLPTPWFFGVLSPLPTGELLLHGGLQITPFGALPAFTSLRLVAGPGGALAWLPAAPMATPRVVHDRGTVVLPDGRVLVAGGCVPGVVSGTTVLQSTAVTEIYDPALDQWTTLQPAPLTFFSGSASVLPNGVVVFAGGMTGVVSTLPTTAFPLSSVLSFDPATQGWQALPAMQTPRIYGASVVMRDGALVLLGGETVTGAGSANVSLEVLRL